MNEAELRDLLRKASRSERPPDRFVASLWSELESMRENSGDARETLDRVADGASHERRPRGTDRSTRRGPERSKSGAIAALAAAVAVLMVGLLAALLAPISGPERTASAPVGTESADETPIATARDARVDQNESALVKTCDRLLVETRVAAVMRPGVVAEATEYRPSGSVATDVSAMELQTLVQAIDQLGKTDEIRGDVRVRHTLDSAAGALDQATLFIEMGEPTLAHDSIVQAKVALGELASESALNGCLETES